MQIGKTLAALRAAKGWTQPQIAEYLTQRGFPVTNKAVSKWETDSTQPDIRQFLLLLERYGVHDATHVFGLTPPSSIFEALNETGKKQALEYIGYLAADARYSDRPVKPRVKVMRSIPLYDLPVSAGVGAFLDSDAYELIDVDETVPLDATFAVRVSGDSMQPRFVDQQIIYIKQQQSLEDGEIGIFLLNGEAYCKKLLGNTLVSLNSKYAPVSIREFDELRIYGKVVA